MRCFLQPTEDDMTRLRGLKELIELEIILSHSVSARGNYNLDTIKNTGIQILQASECHKGCVCGYRCECSRTNECYKCKPPKRFFRVKRCPGDSYEAGEGVQEEQCLEEIQVSPRRIVSRK
jgi:hypothetical protein